MKNLSISIVGNYSFYQRSPAWHRTLADLGHIVHRVDEPLSNSRISSWKRRVQSHLLVGPDFEIAKREAMDKLLSAESDINIFHKSLAFNARDIEAIKQKTGATSVLYNNDNIFGPLSRKIYWRKLRSSIPQHDLILAYRSSCVRNYLQHGAKDVYLLRSYYIPWLHYPCKQTSKSLDISFIGHYENDEREDYLAFLLANLRANISIRGVEWQKTALARDYSSIVSGPIYGNHYCDQLRDSKIALSFFSSLNQDDYTRRVFEIPACGAMLMAPRTETMLSLYDEDKEAIYFSTREELFEKADFYLRNDSVREKIVAYAHQRLLKSGYDIKSRVSEWLSYAVKNTNLSND